MVNAEQRFSHIYIIDAKTGAQEKAVSQGFYSYGNPQFIKENTIVFSGNVKDERHPDRVLESKIYSMQTDGSALKELIGAVGLSAE